MPPASIQTLAAIYVPLSIVTALVVLADIYLAGRRQHMGIMEAVWPLTMLYWGPVGLVFYVWFGRAMPMPGGDHHGSHQGGDHGSRLGSRLGNDQESRNESRQGGDHGSRLGSRLGNDHGSRLGRRQGNDQGSDHGSHHGGHQTDRPMWQATFNGATHCGAGCALGDFIGDWIAFAIGFTMLGSALAGKYLLAFVLAYLFGIVFQYFSVAPMRGLGLRDGLVAAAKIDTLSLLAYEVGMFAWMGFRSWLYPDLQPTDWSYWLMMQVAMVFGFATTYPVNWWLIRRGTKERM